MRVAVILSGQIRNARYCFPSVDKFILQKYSPDVFIETWYPDSEIVSWSDGIQKDTLTINEVIKMYQPKCISIEDFKGEISRCIDEITKEIPVHGNRPNNVYSMYYKIYKSFLQLSNFTQSNQNYYDYIIRLRFDLEFETFPDLNELNSDQINIPIGSDWLNGVNDLLAIGNYANIKKYCELFLKFSDYTKMGISTHPETLLRTHLELENLSVNRFPLKYYLGSKRQSVHNTEINETPIFYIPPSRILKAKSVSSQPSVKWATPDDLLSP